ncbi:hypothetical protein B0H66DRAFT_537380 [Apodospora peruviana]|uniref:Uncharacterized protein n=1 Tax=Apodospora peruviana TaxID=516989 RepID=A0AAE0LZY8_9PEZI|nr:hypothetical protein B0H66DRAFT_537380 [Apodospora peruviana]
MSCVVRVGVRKGVCADGGCGESCSDLTLGRDLAFADAVTISEAVRRWVDWKINNTKAARNEVMMATVLIFPVVVAASADRDAEQSDCLSFTVGRNRRKASSKATVWSRGGDYMYNDDVSTTLFTFNDNDDGEPKYSVTMPAGMPSLLQPADGPLNSMMQEERSQQGGRSFQQPAGSHPKDVLLPLEAPSSPLQLHSSKCARTRESSSI